MKQTLILDVHSDFSAHMAVALAWSVSRVSPELPIHIRVRDCLPQVKWPEQVTVQMLRTRHAEKNGLQWLNKLEALAESPAEETLFLDSDMLAFRDIGHWFGRLGTDDFAFWNSRWTPADVEEGEMRINFLNPHPFCRHYGVAEMPVIHGGGHFFCRRTRRGEAVLQRIADIVVEAAEDPDCLYWRLAGGGNVVSDEAAASMAVVEQGIELPPPVIPAPRPPISVFLPPWQRWTEVDFARNKARYWCEWAQAEIEPDLIHFAYTGKDDAAYKAWLESSAYGLKKPGVNPRKELP